MNEKASAKAKATSRKHDSDAQLAAIWDSLVRGVASARHALHTATLATVRATRDGVVPAARTVVLRRVDVAQSRCLIHSDRRSPKIEDLRVNPTVALLFYDYPGKLQLTLSGTAKVRLDDAIADAQWSASNVQSRSCYTNENAPGTALEPTDDAIRARTPDSKTSDTGRKNFAVIEIQISSIESLELSHRGNTRRRWDLTASPPATTKLAP